MIELIIIAILLTCSAFFSGSETALTAITRSRIYHLVKNKRKNAHIVQKLRADKENLIGAILLGNNLVNIAATSIATTYAINNAGQEWGPLYATIAMTITVLIFSEVLPKTLAINYSEHISLLVAKPLSIIIILLAPFTIVIQKLVHLVLELVGINLSDNKPLVSAKDNIRGAIEMHHNEGEVAKEDRYMLASILDLRMREVEEIMVHRTKVYSINISDKPDDIIQKAINSPHSRIPLWSNNPDNIIGVLHVKDVLKIITNAKRGITRDMIRRAAVKPWFVPETTTLDDQLLAFRKARKHFTCIVDEYGAWLGIVTLEDILEEIVGDIDDEHDKLEIDDIIPFGKNGYKAAGNVTIRDINRALDWELPDQHASTIAGLILHEAKVIPEEGAIFKIHGYKFEINERKANQITLITMEKA